MKSFLQHNDIEYIQHITKWNLSWLKDLLELQKMKIIDTSIGKLDDIVKKYDNTYHSTIKMKPVDIKSKTYIDSSKEINNKDPKFKIGDIVGIWKYKIISEKGYTPNWSVEDFVIKNVKNTLPW